MIVREKLTPKREPLRRHRFPFLYPDGWFQVAYSDELAPREVIPLRYFGKELVLFRTETGRPQVLDAHCAHLGAHLGVGGRVQGDCIVCPFHSWTYDSGGTCVKIPYADRIPRGAHVRAWPTLERSGIVYVWHHHLGSEPAWQPPEIPEADDPEWAGYHRYRWQVRTHTQEIMENIVDAPHIQFVHGNVGPPNLISFQFNEHAAEVVLDNRLGLIDGALLTHNIHILGLGITFNRSTGASQKIVLTTNTPIDEEMTDVRFSLLTPKSAPGDPNGEVARRSAHATALAFEQDIPIWENKIYRDSPVLCAGDGPIAKFRLWAKTFYTGPSNITD